VRTDRRHSIRDAARDHFSRIHIHDSSRLAVMPPAIARSDDRFARRDQRNIGATVFVAL